MEYKNTKTGAIIDSPSNIISKKWILEDKEIVIKGLDKYTKACRKGAYWILVIDSYNSYLLADFK